MAEITQPYRSVPIGIALQVAGKVSIILAPLAFAICANMGWFREFISEFWFYVMLLLIPATWWGFGPFMVRHGKSIAALDAMDVMRRDPRAPVVYLRPFNEDARERTTHDLDAADDYGDLGNHLVVTQLRQLRMLFQGYFGLHDLTLEEEFSLAVREVGPMVAIGRPGEAVQTAGALRFYVADNDWKQAIEEVLPKASIVIWHAGTSQGTWWELETIVKNVDPRRVILIIPSPVRRADAYHDLQRRSKDVLPIPLPNLWEDINVITFDSQWQPQGFSYQFRGPIEKFFSASGLDLQGTLAEFLKDVASLSGSAASVPPSEFPWNAEGAIELGSIALAVLLAVGLYRGGAFLELREAAYREAQRNCERLASGIRTFSGDKLYPAGWAEFVTEAREALAGNGKLACVGGDLAEIVATFERDIPMSAATLLPWWKVQVTIAEVEAANVTAALTLSGNKELLTQWQESLETLAAERHKNTIVVSVAVAHPDWVAKTLLWDSSRVLDRIEKQIIQHLQSLAADSVRVVSARRIPPPELRRYPRRVDFVLNVQFAMYGEATDLRITPAVPDAMVAQISLDGAVRPERGSEFSVSARAQLPERVALPEVRDQQDAALTGMVKQVTAELTAKNLGCADCRAPER